MAATERTRISSSTSIPNIGGIIRADVGERGSGFERGDVSFASPQHGDFAAAEVDDGRRLDAACAAVDDSHRRASRAARG